VAGGKTNPLHLRNFGNNANQIGEISDVVALSLTAVGVDVLSQ
jgi:hypothetical protein